ncbi:MAG: peptide chain release factor N(5)-glutamine methyltransferase [Gemmatimonadales bacterium]|nr:peptide chain release factor N(5)-glutamine methyltransferase [Gemmatimonadales bacterium]
MTAANLIEDATVRLRAAGVVKPKREANRLWAWMHSRNLGEAYLARGEAADDAAATAFAAAVLRRAAGEPLAYVLGSAGFRHLDLRCDRRALIPRPETEGVIELALARVRTGRALDVGTGSGCLALALASEGEFDEVVGVDRSPEALELARENGRLTNLTVRWLESDLMESLQGERFRLIVSNPPYLTAAEYDALDAAVRAWEPGLALVSGEDGMDATRRLLDTGRAYLEDGGWLVMELDSNRSELAAAHAREAGWSDVGIWNDLYGRPRFLTVRNGRGTSV